VRRDQASELTALGQVLNQGEETITLEVLFDSMNIALSSILRHTPEVKVLTPPELVNQVTEALEKLEQLHAN
jgi:predicted DNA-binding transcriptional regulator YafY